MSDWTRDELDAIGEADDLDIAALQAGGSLRPYTTIWVVRVGDALYVRSVLGLKPAPEFEAWIERHPPLLPAPWLLT